jgi:hypothetical protein
MYASRQTNYPNGQFKSWSNSLADDYIHCPVNDEFEAMPLYDMTRCYKKAFKTLQRESKDKYKFIDTHPGHEFSHLTKSKHATIPRIALPKGKMCPLKDLVINHPNQQNNHLTNMRCMQKWHY